VRGTTAQHASCVRSDLPGRWVAASHSRPSFFWAPGIQKRKNAPGAFLNLTNMVPKARVPQWCLLSIIVNPRPAPVSLGTMGMPRKPAVQLTPDGRLYYVDHRNTRWRVHDVAFGPPLAPRFKRRRLTLGDERASDRYFVTQEGERRCYHFSRDDARDLLAETLERQLNAAGIPARGRFDASKHYSP
jgi:hypothetical protein